MRILILATFLLFLVSFSYSQPSEVNGGGWIPRQTECLSESKRAVIQNKIRDNITVLRQEGRLPEKFDRNQVVQFQFPMDWHNGYSDYGFYGIANYVDHNQSFPGSIQDYECGQRSYDTPFGYNHRGIDYYLWPFAWNLVENDAVKIVAAADGIIINKDDGNDHFSCTFNSNDWNAVYLLHDDGSTTWYGHMKENSLTTKPLGAEVVAGEYLGIVASSGNSSGPHLHFEVYDENFSLIDPYAGPCNDFNKESWWIDQHPYIDPAINKIQTYFDVPVLFECPGLAIINDANEFEPGSLVYFVTHFKDQRNTDLCLFSIVKPDGTLFDAWSFYQDNPYYPSSWWYWNAYLPQNAPEGTWIFQCLFNGELYQHEFVVSSGLSSVEDPWEEAVRIYSTPNGIHVENLSSNAIKEFRLTDILGRNVMSFKGPWNNKTTIPLDSPDKFMKIGFVQILFEDGNTTARKILLGE